MATLHTVNKTGQPLQLCLRAAGKQDAILLIEDGVYNLAQARNELNEYRVLVLEADALARGVVYPNDVESVDYIRFVHLTTEYSKVISWF